MLRYLTLAGLGAVGLLSLTTGAEAAEDACAALATLQIEDVNLLSASVVEKSEALPGHCRVLGYVRPAVNFDVRLPTDGWNGKFYMAGCGGFCGRLDSDRDGFVNAANYGLKRGYAVASTDAGHWGQSVLDGRWADHDRVAETDWGHRAVHVTTETAKRLLAAYYGRPHDKAYFAGCSTGGRQAAMSAWKYPEDFDGIIAGAPALDYTGLVATFFSWLVQANTGPDGKDIVPPGKVAMLGDAVYAACDGKDGVEDGLIDDPRACDFQPRTLLCSGADGADCLTPLQVETLEKWYAGPTDSAGQRLYPGGLPHGSEPYWWLWLTGNGKGAGRLIPGFNANFLAYMAFRDDPGEGFTALDFDFDKDPQRLEFMASIYNATNPDLAKFREHGGKMLMYHGWADAIVTPFLTVDYYNRVEEAAGGRMETASFLRLFMVPGMDHCGLLAGPGVDQAGLEPLAVLERWVEQGEAPDQMQATKRDKDGKVLGSRPVCAYPQVAVHDGKGAKELASSFACATR